jgi:predicted nuclease of predicted toxin-antitoxin system
VRFIVDECVGPEVARWLQENGHDVFSVYQRTRGAEDPLVLDVAFKENRILITSDKDFGELIFRQRLPHRGILLLRLKDERSPNKIKTIQQLLDNHPDQIAGNFVVVTERKIRIIQLGRS